MPALQSWNAYDSLREIQEATGEREGAIGNDKRSLELNPENTNAATHIAALTRH
jgi:hypothetical protein